MNDLFVFFLNLIFISVITFGGGAQALLEDMAVNQHAWLTQAEFASGLALAFTTPGPNILITPVFIGYALAGVMGSLIGLAGIFLTPALFAGFATKYLETLLTHPKLKLFESGARSALIGLLVLTALNIFGQVEKREVYLLIAVPAFYLSYRKCNPALLLIGGAVVGLLLQ